MVSDEIVCETVGGSVSVRETATQAADGSLPEAAAVLVTELAAAEV